jgi:hypothetical protein
MKESVSRPQQSVYLNPVVPLGPYSYFRQVRV